MNKGVFYFRKRFVFFFILVGVFFLLPVGVRMCHVNQGKSFSKGLVSKGSLENGYLLPYWGSNFRFYSYLSYFPFGRGYVHQKVYASILDSYLVLEKELPDRTFYIMECSKEKGGNMWPHKTHQNGLSVDFMTPLLCDSRMGCWMDHLGIWRYLLDFDENGRACWDSKISIDFQTVGRHLLVLDRCSRKNGLRIKKVILETNLKDEFFATKEGKALKQRGVYFVRHLPTKINALHDDHYHVDFDFIKE